MLRVTGYSPKFVGFLKAYRETVDEDTEQEENSSIPPLKDKESLAMKDIQSKQHFTQPPPRYTEASLVKELEAKQIGRPSTYAQIISTLRMRKYVPLREEDFRHPTWAMPSITL